jgi:hypothetical protein
MPELLHWTVLNYPCETVVPIGEIQFMQLRQPTSLLSGL